MSEKNARHADSNKKHTHDPWPLDEDDDEGSIADPAAG